MSLYPRLLRSCFATMAFLLAYPAWTQCPNVTVVANGLDGPRGLKFGPDGALYVAEAGRGGPNGGFACEQVPAPVGPYHGGLTARVSRISAHGQRTTVVSGLPSGMSSVPTGDTVGAADLA